MDVMSVTTDITDTDTPRASVPAPRLRVAAVGAGCDAARGAQPGCAAGGAGGGSEYGKVSFFETLKSAFAPGSDPPVFKLWQLAMADFVVRAGLRTQRPR